MIFTPSTPLIREKRFRNARNSLLATIVIVPLLVVGSSVNLTESLRLPMLGAMILVAAGLLLGRRLPRMNAGLLLAMIGWNAMQWASVSVSHFPEESVTVALSCSLCIGFFILMNGVCALDFTFKVHLVRAQALLSVFLCLLGVLQWLWGEGAPLPPHHDPPYATMGNRAFFAEALVLLLPFAFVCWRVDAHRSWRVVGLIALGLGLLLIGLSLIRAAWIAAALEVVIFMLAISGLRRSLKWFMAFGIFLATGVGILFVPKSADYEKAAQSWRAAEVPLISPQEGSATERVIMWRLTAKMAAARPWLGWGAGTWKYEVQGLGLRGFYQGFATRFYPAAHNDFLQAAAETGFVSMGFLLIFWGIGLGAGIKKSLYSTVFLQKIEARAWVAGLAGLLVISSFGFPLQLLFPKLVLFALLALVFHPEKETNREENRFHWLSFLAMVFIGFAGVAGLKIGMLRLRADFHTHQLMTAVKEGNWQLAFYGFNRSTNKWYRTESHTTAPVLWYRYLAAVNLKYWEAAEYEIHEAIRIHPNHPQVMLSLAQWHFMRGEWAQAHEVCERALKIFPDFEAMIALEKQSREKLTN